MSREQIEISLVWLGHTLKHGEEKTLYDCVERIALEARIDEVTRCRNRDVNISVGLALEARLEKLQSQLEELK